MNVFNIRDASWRSFSLATKFKECVNTNIYLARYSAPSPARKATDSFPTLSSLLLLWPSVLVTAFLRHILTALSESFRNREHKDKHLADIKCPDVDTNFIFEYSSRYLTSERSGQVIFCLLYGHRWNTEEVMTTVISSHVKNKNGIFNGYQIFVTGEIVVFHRCLYNN